MRLERGRGVLRDLLVEVGLGDGDDAGDVREGVVVRSHLGLDELKVGNGVDGAAVDDVQENAAAAHVLQELEAEAVALAGALDEAGQVGEGEALVADADDTEHRLQRSERVFGDLGPGVGDGGEQGRLARVGEAEQPHIGEQAQVESERD